MNLVEVAVASFILAATVTVSVSSTSNSIQAESRSIQMGKRDVILSSDIELIREKVGQWRFQGDAAALRYRITKEECQRGLAQVMLSETAFKTSSKLTPKRGILVVGNSGWPTADILLPQAAWCP
jgi:hypothetical protein